MEGVRLLHPLMPSRSVQELRGSAMSPKQAIAFVERHGVIFRPLEARSPAWPRPLQANRFGAAGGATQRAKRSFAPQKRSATTQMYWSASWCRAWSRMFTDVFGRPWSSSHPGFGERSWPRSGVSTLRAVRIALGGRVSRAGCLLRCCAKRSNCPCPMRRRYSRPC
jgi:hypothetical protein